MNTNEVKKELYKSKATAKLVRVVSGTMYYEVKLENGTYQFPILTVDQVTTPLFKIDPATDNQADLYRSRSGFGYIKSEEQYYTLSSDLGTTAFESEMKASDLNRWIAKAIEKEEFIKVS